MSNPKDSFGRYVPPDDEKAAVHLQNADPNSHMRPGGLFDPSKPRRIRTTILADDEDPQEVLGDRVNQRRLMRHQAVGKMVEDALVNRVQPPTGNQTMKVGWEEFKRIRQDSEFQPFSAYGQSLLFYTNGKPRPQPVRPLVQNEVGMYRGRFVVLDQMPEGGRGDTPYVQVKEQLQPRVVVEPDPFPAPKREENVEEPLFKVTEGGGEK